MYLIKKNSSVGFTLIEMLVAIAIFAMLGLASNAVLQTVMRNDEVTKEFSNKLKAIQQGFGALERDFSQMVARTPRLLEGGRGSTVFQTGSDILDSESEAIVFFRLGWLNPDGILPRGSIQSVAYVVRDNNLERWYYPYPEPEFGSDPIKTIVMKDVISVEYSFFMEDKWERKVEATDLPKAIAMEIELEGLGKIQRKFLLPVGARPDSGSGNNNGGSNNGGNNNGGNNNGGNNNGGNNNGGDNNGGDNNGGDNNGGDTDENGRDKGNG
ncbi:type II secretion system minor pseudopilin GspJ [Shewanella sp. D64]|uniref:type II secretion system minor pseudopilin GspJ n=1 Tax=unclassified Shewanella TaxID=196818 RepID=UPI002DD68D02|nr:MULTISPECIES: type II secretion system minor pseudopilin GspJ [unclassified Shewanella]MEC4726193.1 type II secretion system minor pseudopilin GspJ [Shewanella sp. D64]MEC4738205.1 type II secretion system minor pseudopilin GspJ [Shewanella sp. E94]